MMMMILLAWKKKRRCWLTSWSVKVVVVPEMEDVVAIAMMEANVFSLQILRLLLLLLLLDDDDDDNVDDNTTTTMMLVPKKRVLDRMMPMSKSRPYPPFHDPK
jgi:hypothetical protein